MLIFCILKLAIVNKLKPKKRAYFFKSDSTTTYFQKTGIKNCSINHEYIYVGHFITISHAFKSFFFLQGNSLTSNKWNFTFTYLTLFCDLFLEFLLHVHNKICRLEIFFLTSSMIFYASVTFYEELPLV